MNFLERIIREEVIRQIEEMAYPISFNFEEFKKIKSFSGKQKYAQQNLPEKLGQGSSRAVFRVDEEKVIKIALNKKGLLQNEAEIEPFKQNYEIVSRVFDYDKNDNMWLEMEYAEKVTPKRFEELTNIKLDDLKTYLLSKKYDYIKIDKELFNKINDNEFVQELMSLINDYGYPIAGDFGKASSYGEVTRNGKPTIVLIDFGYTEKVEKIYYPKRF
jgi:hypothetical protein